MSKKRLIRSSVFSSCAIIALLLSIILVFGTVSYGWFANSTTANANNMQIIMRGDDYEVYIPKTNKYDNNTVYEGITNFKNVLVENGNTFNNTNNLITGSNLTFELDNEYASDGVYYLVPGSYGSFTFYIKKTVDSDIEVNFNISMYGYKKSYNTDNVVIPYIPTNNPSYNKALDMLKGHILFFEERDVDNHGEPTHYRNLINGSHFSYSTSGKSKDSVYTDYYKVTVYWEWPLLYEDIANNTSTSETTKRYPSELLTYLNNHRSYFFAINENSNVTIELSDGYNDGDQLIGDNIHYLIVKLD